MSAPFAPVALFGNPCAACGKPVWPPTTLYMKAAQGFNGRIWHGDCFPREGVSETITTNPPLQQNCAQEK